jgi:putative phosphoribosyl transferase
MSFKDRSDAGRKLVLALADYKNQQPVVLALPRGGVPVATINPNHEADGANV